MSSRCDDVAASPVSVQPDKISDVAAAGRVSAFWRDVTSHIILVYCLFLLHKLLVDINITQVEFASRITVLSKYTIHLIVQK